MVTLAQVEAQLKRISYGFSWTSRAEVRELVNILMPDEVIAACVNGRYENGFALLCVTNHRMLLVDRKPMFLSLEDIRFDMITEIDYRAQLLDNTLHVQTPNHKLVFRSWNQHRLRELVNFTQQRIMEVRQQYLSRQFQPSNQPYAAPLMGGLVMPGASAGAGQTLPLNPYTRVPILMRRRRYPSFY
ncbi:MAG TPA: PH domain-containing protein [Candidatus Saccharimonadales bacterium]|nr:PH domain-containing protein [Candidatus Saccharimonadales bacterium]